MARTQKQPNVYFYRSKYAVVILSTLTLGFYSLYWFYRQWNAVSKNTGQKKHAVWAAIFSVFTFYNLLRHMARMYDKTLKKEEIVMYTVSYIATNIAAGVVLGVGSVSLMTLVNVFIICGIASLFLGWMQHVVNNYILINKIKVVKKVRPAEVTFIGIGLLVAALDVVLYTVPNYGLPVLSAEDTVRSQVLLKKSQDLQVEYNECSSKVNSLYQALDNTDPTLVDDYNKIYDTCEAVRIEQNKAVDDYNKLNLGIYSFFSR